MEKKRKGRQRKKGASTERRRGGGGGGRLAVLVTSHRIIIRVRDYVRKGTVHTGPGTNIPRREQKTNQEEEGKRDNVSIMREQCGPEIGPVIPN